MSASPTEKDASPANGARSDATPAQLQTERIRMPEPRQEAEVVAAFRPTEPRAVQTEKAVVSSREYPEVAGYEILEELGRGGMGVVYKARQHGVNRIVALKMVLGGPFAEPEFLSRFQSEAEAIGRLQHPHIVQIFAVGTQESALGQAFSCPYFVQEYVEDGNLADRLTGGPQRPNEAAQFIAILARAVHYAHEHDIVHRDLKPANILLRCKEGVRSVPAARGDTIRLSLTPLSNFEPKITDFGIAKQLNNPGAIPTGNTTMLGTPEYMAPEQAGFGATVGPAADIYALGVILYEMVTGRRPFEGASVLDTLEQLRNQEPVSLRRLQPKIPRDLETICMKCLRKEPYRRYTSALALAEDLERFLQHEPIHARPVGPLERTWRWALRRPTVAALLALVVLTAFGGVCGITLAWLHALAGWRLANHEQLRAEHAQATAEHRQDEAEANLYFSRIAQVQLERRLSSFSSAETLLEQCRPPQEGIRDRRGWEWHYLKGLLHADLLTIPAAHSAHVFELAFSPDGRQLATAGGSPKPSIAGEVRIWNAWGTDAGKRLHDISHPDMVTSIVYTTEGRYIAWATFDGIVQQADAESGQIIQTEKLPPEFQPAVFSPDGRHYASFTKTGRIAIWELASGREVRSFSVEGGQPYSLAFSQDGRQLAVSVGGTIGLWDLTTGKVLRIFSQASGPRSRPVFSPDGRLLALGTGGGVACIWDVTTGQLMQSLAGHTGDVSAVAFSPDSRYLATGGTDHLVHLWEAGTGRQYLPLRGHQGRVSCLAFHPSGRYLASGDKQPGEIKVWDLTRHQEYVTVSAPVRIMPQRIEGLGFASDGGRVYIPRGSGWLQVSDAVSGMDLEYRPLNLSGVWRTPAALAAFRADGQQMAVVGREDQRIVEVMDLPSGNSRHHLTHAYEVLHVSFSHHGQRLATSAATFRGDGRREVKVWETETGQLVTTIQCPPFIGRGTFGVVAISPDGNLLAHDEYLFPEQESGNPKRVCRVQLRDLSTGEIRQTLECLPDMIRSLAFSPDGRFLALGHEDRGVRIYDCEAAVWLHPEPLSASVTDTIRDLAFSPDSQRLAGASRIQAHLWDVLTGQMILTLQGGPPRPSDKGLNSRIAWSPDGRRLAASQWNSSVTIWDAADRQTPAAKQALYQAAEERANKR